MRRVLFLACAFVLAAAIKAEAIDIEPTELVYTVKYKWGLIDATAGNAYLYVQCTDDNFFGTLQGKSVPIDGRSYCVTDTLQATMSPQSEQVVYVNGWYRKPHVHEHVDLDSPKHYVNIHGQGLLSASPETLEAVTITAHMIDLCYYARSINFQDMQPGQTVTIPIAGNSGAVNSLNITYNGMDHYSDSCPCQMAYDITFEFGIDGESQFPVRCKIDAETLLPVHFSAELVFGHAQMTLIR